MLDWGTLAELKDLWGGTPPHVKADRCLNVRLPERECRICVESCPVNAISIPGGGGAEVHPLALDPDACVRCGLCLNVCPTEVFVGADPPQAELAQTAARSPGQVVELACPRKEQPELSRVPEASVVQTPRCLAAVSVPTLLELAATGRSVWMNDSLCHACPIGEARHTIRRSISVANRWLEVMGHVPAIHSHLDSAQGLADEATARPLVRAERHLLSRRDLFRSLTGRRVTAGSALDGGLPGQDQAAAIPSAGLDTRHTGSAEDTTQRASHYIPARRQRLAQALRRLSPHPTQRVPTAALPVADVMVTDVCTACGLCARFCPTEAIVFLSDAGYYVLHFSAALCLGEDCSLCRISCPTDAVRFGRDLMADELLGTQPRPVRAGALAPCSRCGALTDAPMDGDGSAEIPLCYVCRAQADRPPNA